MTTQEIEFGLDSPAFVSVDESGQPLNGAVVIRNTVEEGVFADAVGIDSFNISEHYRPDFMDSAGHVMLAAIAGRTERIRLGTAVTVLSTQDPVRVYTEFATLDAVSNGRAQLIVGRGSLTESFPLFGFDACVSCSPPLLSERGSSSQATVHYQGVHHDRDRRESAVYEQSPHHRWPGRRVPQL